MAKVIDPSKITLNAAGWMWLGCLELLQYLMQQNNVHASVFWLTLEGWKHWKVEMEISFFHPCFGKTGDEDFISPILVSHQSQMKGCSHSCHSEIRPCKQSTSKEPGTSSALVPGIVPGRGTGTLASQNPAATVLSGQQDRESSVCTAGASQYCIYTSSYGHLSSSSASQFVHFSCLKQWKNDGVYWVFPKR